MQTFLPYEGFKESVKVLDSKRLNKQIVETWQIYTALTTGKGWIYHPITKMWKGYETSLLIYGKECYSERVARGFGKHKSGEDILRELNERLIRTNDKVVFPIWLGNKLFHYRQQCNLVRKSDNYLKFFPDADQNQKYVWYDMDLNKWFEKTAEMKERNYI